MYTAQSCEKLVHAEQRLYQIKLRINEYEN